MVENTCHCSEQHLIQNETNLVNRVSYDLITYVFDTHYKGCPNNARLQILTPFDEKIHF